MKKIVLIYGAIAGALTIGFMTLSLSLAGQDQPTAALEWL